MNEYDLHTRGAAHRSTDTYDGNDPSRNRAAAPAAASAATTVTDAALRYTSSMGQAAQQYFDAVLPGNWLGARFRWQGVWQAMVDAMPRGQLGNEDELQQAIHAAFDDGKAHSAGRAAARKDALEQAIFDAIDILTAEADSLRECHTSAHAPDDWTGEDEAKANYDRMLSTVAALRALIDKESTT